MLWAEQWALLGRAEPEVPAVYHFATMNINPCSTYNGQRMGVRVEVKTATSTTTSAVSYWISNASGFRLLAVQYGKKQTTLNNFLTSSAWKVGP